MNADRIDDAVAAVERRIRERIPAHVLGRLISASLASGTGLVLLIAVWLEPSPAGHGTHTQLGLGSCSFLALTGYPCPMCGATTTFTLAAHLRPIDAVVNQPFAFLLFLMTVVTFGVSLAEVAQPRDRWTRILGWLGPWEGRLATLFLAAMGAGWMYKILLMNGVG